ncbi:hypothetical protein KCV06_g579, partial [Aureobasidium melanogenum]
LLLRGGRLFPLLRSGTVGLATAKHMIIHSKMHHSMQAIGQALLSRSDEQEIPVGISLRPGTMSRNMALGRGYMAMSQRAPPEFKLDENLKESRFNSKHRLVNWDFYMNQSCPLHSQNAPVRMVYVPVEEAMVPRRRLAQRKVEAVLKYEGIARWNFQKAITEKLGGLAARHSRRDKGQGWDAAESSAWERVFLHRADGSDVNQAHAQAGHQLTRALTSAVVNALQHRLCQVARGETLFPVVRASSAAALPSFAAAFTACAGVADVNPACRTRLSFGATALAAACQPVRGPDAPSAAERMDFFQQGICRSALDRFWQGRHS